jgi:hypothetical protein
LEFIDFGEDNKESSLSTPMELVLSCISKGGGILYFLEAFFVLIKKKKKRALLFLSFSSFSAKKKLKKGKGREKAVRRLNQ